MHTITSALQTLTVGASLAHANLTMFPLVAPANEAARALDYMILDEALAKDLVRITEVSEAASVPELLLSNDAATRVLLLDGEELIGAKQNRVLNLTILVGAGQTLVIPVSCVEQGRWGYRSREFRAADRQLFARARAAKMAQVTRSMKEDGLRFADQSAVWDSVALRASEVDAHSPTGAMADIYEQRAEQLSAFRTAITAQPSQYGAAFAVDGELVGLELLDSAQSFAKLLPKMLNGYALDAVASARKGAVAAATGEAVKAFVAALSAARFTEHEALGEGTDVRLESDAVNGGALVADGRVVHLSAFATSAARGGEDRRRRFYPGPRRMQ